MAPIAEQNKAILFAAISSAPQLSTAGDYIFRATPLMTNESPLLANYAKSSGVKKLALISEETEFCLATTDRLEDIFTQNGGRITTKKTFRTGEADVRGIVTSLRLLKPDAVYISTQSADSAELLMREIRSQKISALILANSAVGNAMHAPGVDPSLFEGIVYAEPYFDRDAPATRAFIARYKEKNNGEDFPYGIWTAEAYDVVKLIAKILAECGEDPESVKRCLYGVKDYEGASGQISIDDHGDGIREFALQRIHEGKHEKVRSANAM